MKEIKIDEVNEPEVEEHDPSKYSFTKKAQQKGP
jgi:hypothetical protein